MKLSKVKIVFFPPNCTKRLQPDDLGIITTLKRGYRRNQITRVLARIDQGDDAETVPIDVLEVRLAVTLPLITCSKSLSHRATIYYCRLT